LSKCNLSRLIQ